VAESELFPVRAADEPKIAVLIDQGGEEVADLLDLDKLSEHARSLPGVQHVEVTRDAAKTGELLRTGNFNRLIVAGPSPITHERVFQSRAEMAGLNRYLVELVNLHNQCARVHSTDKAEATDKAKTLMKMGVARARQLEPLAEVRVRITQSCLIVGGCPSGVACAAMLARMGVKVHLVEREADLTTILDNDHPLVQPLVAGLSGDKHITIHAPASVVGVRGSVGDFKVDLVQERAEENIEVGAIVVASGPAIGGSSEGTGFEASLALEKDSSGLYVSTQGILNPLDFTTDGVFNCGPARAVLTAEDAVVEGEAAASRAACILSSSVMDRPPVISSVIDQNCDGCAYCVDPCPTRSITLLEFVRGSEIKKVVEVSEATCIGCGICMATCPKEGILVRHFKPEYFSDMVKAALEDDTGEEGKPIIVCFCCNRCAYPGADAAGLAGIQYPASIRIIRTVCAGMIHPNIITNALEQGADGVLLCGCHPGNCRSREGIRKAQARAEGIGLLMEDFGLESERFRLELIAASEGAKFAKVAGEMTEELVAIGPSPYK
jgi:heterodisulfide reductase subunit A-like polyferredoxin/coenzyme F420-reducing hydrogenase delta subunit